jgi:hypothetical protein
MLRTNKYKILSSIFRDNRWLIRVLTMYNKPSRSTLILSTSKFHQMGDQVAARTVQNLISLILPVQEVILKTQVAEET